jgi:hypothetical protein
MFEDTLLNPTIYGYLLNPSGLVVYGRKIFPDRSSHRRL